MLSAAKRLLSIGIILSLLISLLSLPLKANEIALRLCDGALTACEASHEVKREVIDAQENLLRKIVTQRNAAFDRLAEEESYAPWYLWFILGAAGGVIFSSSVLSK